MAIQPKHSDRATGAQPAPQSARGSLRLRVRRAAETALRSGHPWLFAESIREQNRPGGMGELAVVYDRPDRFLAIGLFDPTSAIRCRILQVGRPLPIDATFWRNRLQAALHRRAQLFDAETTGFRWINGESDGWPGLVLDRYGSTLVLKLYTAAWLPCLDEILDIITDQLQPERIVLRLSRNARESAAEFGRTDGQIVRGAPLAGPVIFLETGLQFEADVLKGQKTGFFLDQRENRRRLETFARGASLLNAFAFSGGFSVYAACGGALSVTDLDISPHALSAGRRNFALNPAISGLQQCARKQIQADAFDWLAGYRGSKFQVIVLDPPSLAKREQERAAALQAYASLATLAIKHLAPKGLLLACSCSAHVSAEQFYQAVLSAGSGSGRSYREIARTGQPPDHPAAFQEAQYLKAVYLRFN